MPDETPITSEHMRKWNKLQAFVKAKGYAGKEELDHNEGLRKKIFAEYNAANPNDAVPYEMVKPIQKEFLKYRQSAIDSVKAGKGAFAQGVNEKNFMSWLSGDDDKYGKYTSQQFFPDAYILNKTTGEKKKLGFAGKVDMTSLNTAKSVDEFFKK